MPITTARGSTRRSGPRRRSRRRCARAIEAGGEIVALPPPGTPFDPESRLYARSAGDDKAVIVAMLAGLDALRASGAKLKSSIKLVFDGEEERGSPSFEAILAANKAAFAADLYLVCDGPVHQTRRPLVYFGARDNVLLDVTVYGIQNLWDGMELMAALLAM
jgi:acetylornithine deacetylase/succinyl-diaminopimelate desuccinylase-like protein